MLTLNKIRLKKNEFDLEIKTLYMLKVAINLFRRVLLGQQQIKRIYIEKFIVKQPFKQKIKKREQR